MELCVPREVWIVVVVAVVITTTIDGLPWWLRGKEFTCNAGATGDEDSSPGSGRHPGEGNGNPLQHSCLENPMD